MSLFHYSSCLLSCCNGFIVHFFFFFFFQNTSSDLRECAGKRMCLWNLTRKRGKPCLVGEWEGDTHSWPQQSRRKQGSAVDSSVIVLGRHRRRGCRLGWQYGGKVWGHRVKAAQSRKIQAGGVAAVVGWGLGSWKEWETKQWERDVGLKGFGWKAEGWKQKALWYLLRLATGEMGSLGSLVRKQRG